MSTERDVRSLTEGAWRRGASDFTRWVKSLPFLLIELIGGAAISAFNPIAGIVFVLGTLFLVWLAATATAPIRQRDEARALSGRVSETERLGQHIATGRSLQHRIVRTDRELATWLDDYDRWVIETSEDIAARWGTAEKELFNTVENLSAAMMANAFGEKHNLKKLILDRRLKNLRDLVQRRGA